jgi:hypothetical protein
MDQDPKIPFSVLRSMPPGRAIQVLGMKDPRTGKHIEALQWEAADGASGYYDLVTGEKIADEVAPSIV